MTKHFFRSVILFGLLAPFLCVAATPAKTDEPIPLLPMIKVQLSSGEIRWRGQGGVPWMEALEHQPEVLDCKDGECFSGKIGPHADVARASLDDYPEPRNREWKGLGKDACPIAQYAGRSIPSGSFPYNGGADLEEIKVGTIGVSKTAAQSAAPGTEVR